MSRWDFQASRGDSAAPREPAAGLQQPHTTQASPQAQVQTASSLRAAQDRSSLPLQAGWHKRDLLQLVLQGQGALAAALAGGAAAGDAGGAGDAGAAVLQRPRRRERTGTGIFRRALLHPPPRLGAAGLLAGHGRSVLLQGPPVDPDGGWAGRLHVAHLHPPPGLASAAAWLRRAAAPGRARLQRLASLWLTLAGPLEVAAEAARVVAWRKIRGVGAALVAVPLGTGLCPALLSTHHVLGTVVFVAVSPVAESREPGNHLG